MPRFEINFLDDYTDDSLLDEIRRVAGQNPGSSLPTDTFDRLSGRVSASTIRLAPTAHWKWTDEQCLENLAAVWTHFGRQPAHREMFEAPSTVSGRAYSRWGTWRKALRAFVEWANSENDGATTEPSELPKPPEQTETVTARSNAHFDVSKRISGRLVHGFGFGFSNVIGSGALLAVALLQLISVSSYTLTTSSLLRWAVRQ
jgi:Homing endonuclease associated repeat